MPNNGTPRSSTTRALVKRQDKIPRESSEQIKFVNRVRHFYPEVVVHAIPNGGKRTPMEATRLKEEGVLAGTPDLFVLEARGTYFGLYVEMKRQKGGAVSEAQHTFITRALARGYKTIVGEGADDAWGQFEDYMRERPTLFV